MTGKKLLNWLHKKGSVLYVSKYMSSAVQAIKNIKGVYRIGKAKDINKISFVSVDNKYKEISVRRDCKMLQDRVIKVYTRVYSSGLVTPELRQATVEFIEQLRKAA